MIAEYLNKEIKVYSPVVSGTSYAFILEEWNGEEFIFTKSVITINSGVLKIDKDGYYRVSEYPLTTTGTYYIDNNILYGPNGETDGEDLVNDVVPEETYDLVVYEYLETFYKDLISDKLIKGICNCNCTSSHDEVVIQTLTIGLEMLKILEKYKQYYEVYRILKQLETCDNFVNINCDCNG